MYIYVLFLVSVVSVICDGCGVALLVYIWIVARLVE
ncbi:hypothetical protein CPL00188L_CDS0069 [Escherichia phage WaterSpirit]